MLTLAATLKINKGIHFVATSALALAVLAGALVIMASIIDNLDRDNRTPRKTTSRWGLNVILCHML
jgi:hypothetical protein